MIDIAALLYQMKVAEKHFLQFLWWEDSDINESAVDHEIFVHILVVLL